MRRKNIRETLNTHVSIDKQIKRQSVCLSVAFSFFMFASFWFLLICRELELVLMTMPDAGCWCWSASLFAGFLILISLSATAYHNKQHVNTYLKPQCSVTTSHNSLRATHALRFYVVTSSLLTAKWALKVRKTNMVLISVRLCSPAQIYMQQQRQCLQTPALHCSIRFDYFAQVVVQLMSK